MNRAIEDRLLLQTKKGLKRELVAVERAPKGRIHLDNKTLINFSSNDYLGLSFHEEIKKAFCEGVEKYGVGAGGSALVCGFDKEKERLQETFSLFLKSEKSLFFQSGYTANLSVISALCDEKTEIFIDKFSHASIYDALSLKGLSYTRYHHIDMMHLESLLKASKQSAKLIISEGIFSMTGTKAPLADLVRLKKQYGATLFIDDAHALGVLGNQGAGSRSAYTQDDIDIVVCPLSKASASTGAIVSASALIIDALIQFSRPFMYSTALPAYHAFGLQKTLSIIEDSSQRRSHLYKLIRHFKSHQSSLPYTFLPSDTPIQLLYLGDNEKALHLFNQLKDTGFYCYPMRAPTIPKKYTGLRIVITYALSFDDIDSFANALKDAYGTLS